MISEKKILSLISNLENYSKLAVSEAEKIRMLLDKELTKPAKVSEVNLSFHKRKSNLLSKNKAAAITATN